MALLRARSPPRNASEVAGEVADGGVDLREADLRDAMQRAAQSIDSGAAWTKLRQLAAFSQVKAGG